MMKFKRVALAVAIAVAGCSQEAPRAPEAVETTQPAPVAEVPAPVVPAAPVELPPAGDEVFSVSPGSFRACEAVNGAVVATAKWDVTASGVPEVSIYVEAPGPGNERKLWLNGGPTGQSTTDNWVFDQTRFEMVERSSGKPIAEVVVKAVPCE